MKATAGQSRPEAFARKEDDMKRLLSIFLAAVMLLGVMPWQVFAEGEKNVTLVGQWVNDSSQKKDVSKHYELTDKIGPPEYNSGLLRGLAKQFLGWSDKAPADNGVLADGAKLFSPEDTISDVFGSSIPNDAKLYAVYYEVNKPYGDPFPQDPLSMLALGSVLENLKDRVNKNEITINNDVAADDVLNKTDIAKSGDTIVDYYEKKDDVNDINEVVLRSEFNMDWVVAMLAYRNQTGSNALRPVLSYDYNTRYKNNDFPTKDGVDAGYTYVDLNMDFGTDKGLVIPDNLFLEFKSYTWRPLYAFGINDDGTKTVLQMLDQEGTKLSKDPGIVNQGDFEKIGSGDKPESTFGVETKGYRKITIRVVLREWDNRVEKPHQTPFSAERIPESKIPKEPAGTVASEILSNMTLRVLGSADGIENKNIVKISDAKARALADGEAKDTIDIKGTIKGHVFAEAGSVSAFGITVPLKQDLPIDESTVKKPVKLSYIHKKEEPKPEPKPDNGGMWILPGGGKKEEATEDHMAYIFGYPDKSVRPEGNLTRAEAAAMVTRLGRLDLSDASKADYPDLKDGAWYLPYINAALKAGMLDTDDAGNLRPDAPVTRGEFVKMIAAIDRPSEGKAPFMDIAGHKYEKEINQVYGNRRAIGYEDGSFKPDNTLTRAESAAFLNRVFNRVADDKAVEGFEARLAKFTDLQKGTWFYYELVEATNSHQLVRRGGQDDLARDYERWTNLWYNKEAK